MHRNGRWKDRQVIPAAWVKESTRYHSDAALYGVDGYGYMWWVTRHHNKFPHLPNVQLPEGSYSARGWGGHYLLILPSDDLVICHRVNTFRTGMDGRVGRGEFGKLVRLILAARETKRGK